MREAIIPSLCGYQMFLNSLQISYWGLKPVILATGEAEIRSLVQGQPGQQKAKPYLKNTQHTKKG
jgi:hypothetical protein